MGSGRGSLNQLDGVHPRSSMRRRWSNFLQPGLSSGQSRPRKRRPVGRNHDVRSHEDQRTVDEAVCLDRAPEARARPGRCVDDTARRAGLCRGRLRQDNRARAPGIALAGRHGCRLGQLRRGRLFIAVLRCVLAGLEPFDVPWRTDPDVLMRLAAEAPTTNQLRQIAAQVINALDACDVPHGVIVIDDL